jgi:hypothetical protein
LGELVLAAKVSHVPSLMLSEAPGSPLREARREERRYREFLDMLPDYAVKCNGEGGMADTIMLFAALGWNDYCGQNSSATISPPAGAARSKWSFTSRRE